MAAIVHCSARFTQDIDLVYARSAENIERLVTALSTHQPYLRGAPPGLPLDWSVVTLQAGLNFTLITKLGATAERLSWNEVIKFWTVLIRNCKGVAGCRKLGIFSSHPVHSLKQKTFNSVSSIMSRTEEQARALLAQLTAKQRLQLALEILQEDVEGTEVDLPAWLIEASTHRLARYQADPGSGLDAREALAALRAKYGK